MSKKMKQISQWVICLVLAFSWTFTQEVSVLASDESQVELTDMVGRKVVLPEGPVTQVVALMPADAEILYAIEAGDTLVGRGSYVDYPADKVKDIPSLTTGPDMNIEELVALKPQLVIMSTMGMTPDQVKQVEAAGIPVLVTEAKTIEEVYQAIELIGKAVGNEEKASQLIDDMKKTFEEYSQKAKEKTPAGSVYYEISPLEFGLWTAGSETFMDELGQMIGLTNVFADQKDFVEVSEETVLAKNPDFIFTTSMPMDANAPSPVDEILGRKSWQEVKAVKDKKVFMVDNSAFTRPGPRLTEAMKALYETVYEK